MKNRIFFPTLCLCVFVFNLFAETEITSRLADFDGQKLTLGGGVRLTHLLGSVHAEEAQVSQNKRITLHGDVKVQLSGRGQLRAPFAELNENLQQAFFSGGDEGQVIYTEEQPFLQIKSLELTADLDPHKKIIKSLTAEKEVAIFYRDKMRAEGDLAIYMQLPGKSGAEILLKAVPPHQTCALVNSHFDRVEAATMLFNPFLKTVSFCDAQGAFNLPERQDKMQFAALNMQWDDLENHLVLENSVKIDAEGFGQLLTEGPLHFYRDGEAKSKKIVRCLCDAPSLLSYRDKVSGASQVLTAPGQLSIDLVQMITRIAPDPKGKKIRYEDQRGTLEADEAELYYTRREGKVTPVKLILRSDVQIVNREAPSPDLQEHYAQYVLCERAEYLFDTAELTLSSNDDGRVLLFDQVNHLRLSAPAIAIKRDDALQRESIRGIGDVRLTFVDQELEKLKKRFQFEDTP